MAPEGGFSDIIIKKAEIHANKREMSRTSWKQPWRAGGAEHESRCKIFLDLHSEQFLEVQTSYLSFYRASKLTK